MSGKNEDFNFSRLVQTARNNQTEQRAAQAERARLAQQSMLTERQQQLDASLSLEVRLQRFKRLSRAVVLAAQQQHLPENAPMHRPLGRLGLVSGWVIKTGHEDGTNMDSDGTYRGSYHNVKGTYLLPSGSFVESVASCSWRQHQGQGNPDETRTIAILRGGLPRSIDPENANPSYQEQSIGYRTYELAEFVARHDLRVNAT